MQNQSHPTNKQALLRDRPPDSFARLVQQHLNHAGRMCIRGTGMGWEGKLSDSILFCDYWQYFLTQISDEEKLCQRTKQKQGFRSMWVVAWCCCQGMWSPGPKPRRAWSSFLFVALPRTCRGLMSESESTRRPFCREICWWETRPSFTASFKYL